ncbi:MAG: Gfo/Idh/MocA family oxidoreductase [Planctomycetes bacterium]|nr:Gfo/Idh/MocA family oxidoreductase [Planctomycetota bacterium]
MHPNQHDAHHTRIRYGFIGCGAINQRRHMPEVQADPRCQISAVCDINQARAVEVGARFGAPTYTDYRQMLREAVLDAVVIATPNCLHARMSVDALMSGRHVLVEKPMATSAAEGQAILTAQRASGKVCMVGHNQRYMPPHRKAKQLLEAGALGRIIGFRSSLKHSGPDNWSVDGRDSWFLRRQEAVMGAIGDMAVHKADLLRWLLGVEFADVGGCIGTLSKRYPDGRLIDVDDTVSITLSTTGGIIGSIEASWTNFSGDEDNQTIIYGERGVMDIGGDPAYGVVVRYADGTREAHAVGAIATNKQQTASGVTAAFTHCILTGERPLIDAAEGYRSMMVVVTALQAAQEARRLAIPAAPAA